jgi:hypothetical protein
MEHRARVLKDIEKQGGVGGDIGKIEGNGKRSLFKYAVMGGMLFIVFILWYLNEVLSLMEQQKLLRLRYEQLGMKEGAQFQQTGVVMSPKSKSLLRTSAGFVTVKYVSKNVSTGTASSMPPDGKHLTVLPPPTTVVSAAVLKPPIITLINVSTARVPTRPPEITPFHRYGTLMAASSPAVRSVVIGLSQKGSDESFAIFIGSLRVSK